MAVCNLGSVNLVQHVVDGKLNMKKLEEDHPHRRAHAR